MGRRWLPIIVFAGFLPCCRLLYGQNEFFSDDAKNSGAAVIVVERSGGFAGVHERYKIYDDGTVLNKRGQSRQIGSDIVQSIVRKADGLTIRHYSKSGLADAFCSDCLRYRIVVKNPSGRIVLTFNEPQLGGDDSVSGLARSIRDLLLSLKWK